MRRPHGIAAALIVSGALAIAVGVYVAARSPSNRLAAAAVPIVNRGTVFDHHKPATRKAPAASHHGLPAGSLVTYVRLGVHAPVHRVHLVRHVMQIPRDPRILGWWTGGAAPGDASGSVVIVGHINYAGTSGALAVLPRALPGDRVDVGEPGGAVYRYRVDAVRTYPKTTGIPSSAFTASGAPRLVLITCGGPFDASTGNYEDNIVVYAEAD